VRKSCEENRSICTAAAAQRYGGVLRTNAFTNRPNNSRCSWRSRTSRRKSSSSIRLDWSATSWWRSVLVGFRHLSARQRLDRRWWSLAAPLVRARLAHHDHDNDALLSRHRSDTSG